MSEQYSAISWNPKKRIYDLLLLSGILLYFAVFVGITAALNPTKGSWLYFIADPTTNKTLLGQ